MSSYHAVCWLCAVPSKHGLIRSITRFASRHPHAHIFGVGQYLFDPKKQILEDVILQQEKRACNLQSF